LIDLFKSITVPISKINLIEDVISDPLVKEKLLHSKDPVSGTEITLAPSPYLTPLLKKNNRQLSFPPRFGEHNSEFYGQIGYTDEMLAELKEKGVV
jgi:formyl-CoA transferase